MSEVCQESFATELISVFIFNVFSYNNSKSPLNTRVVAYCLLFDIGLPEFSLSFFDVFDLCSMAIDEACTKYS